MSALELSDIQGIVTSGLAHLPHARFVFLQVQNKTQAKAWLKTLLPQITNSARRSRSEEKPKTAVQIAFTVVGLTALGLPPDATATFPREFIQGMGHGERTRVLGDTGDCDPAHWEFCGTATPEVHILLMLYASSEARLEALAQETIPTVGMASVYAQDSFRRDVYEPFGFRDGISQPAIEGGVGRTVPGQDVLKAGEFILGYTNEYEVMTPVPSLSARQDLDNLLTADADDRERRAFGKNGTYFVFRKLAQDVEGFWNFFEEQTKNPDGTGNKAKRDWLAAKFVGRWPSGAPMTLCPEQDDPALGADEMRNNDFKFTEKDAQGYGCPIGAHIRRGNPRDMLPPGPEKSSMVSNRHRILRRGRPYEETKDGTKTEQGLLFMAVNADIQRQFEFIQQTWCNSPKFGGLTESRDPLVSNTEGGGVMVLERKPVRERLHGLPRFVTMKGGGYFFLPGLRALRVLTGLP